MNGLLDDIAEIPSRAEECYEKNRGIELPEGVPYVGMGASWHAALTLLGCRKDIAPHVASEYYSYISRGELPLGVLISQSGETSETLWNLERFQKIVAITNYAESSLAASPKTQKAIELHAGKEEFSSTKTYVNTLLTLYLGLNIDPREGIDVLKRNFTNMRESAQEEAKRIAKHIASTSIKGLSVLGSGPNRGTALQGALTLSETTKHAWTGASIAQYDHGPKETANDSVVIILNSNGKDAKRISSLKKTLKAKSNALVVELQETQLPEALSPLTLTVQLNFLMSYLAGFMGISTAFHIGAKVTTVPRA